MICFDSSDLEIYGTETFKPQKSLQIQFKRCDEAERDDCAPQNKFDEFMADAIVIVVENSVDFVSDQFGQ